jgi:hypothetical protein
VLSQSRAKNKPTAALRLNAHGVALILICRASFCQMAKIRGYKVIGTTSKSKVNPKP